MKKIEKGENETELRKNRKDKGKTEIKRET
jgi:hypothetical protein